VRATSPAQKEDDAAAIVTVRGWQRTMRGWQRTVRAAGSARVRTEVFLTAILIAIAMVSGSSKGLLNSWRWGRIRWRKGREGNSPGPQKGA